MTKYSLASILPDGELLDETAVSKRPYQFKIILLGDSGVGKRYPIHSHSSAVLDR